MMNNPQEKSWPGWKTGKLIGRGRFGEVYEIERTVFGEEEKAALKIISVPLHSDEIEEEAAVDECSEANQQVLERQIKKIVGEYHNQKRLSFCANIVRCDDIQFYPHEDGKSGEIHIKMELLIPLMRALPRKLADEEVIRFAKDICHALIACKQNGILHRDLKPHNIFRSENGVYKLGDFGISKSMEGIAGGTETGTYKYMAPEVYNHEPYGHQADLYSLGMVMYWMLNERRVPFQPRSNEITEETNIETANKRRFAGEAIPQPKDGSEMLRAIVMKACEYEPKARYQSAEEMLQALETLEIQQRNSKGIKNPSKRMKRILFGVGAVIFAVVVAAAGWGLLGRAGQFRETSVPKDAVEFNGHYYYIYSEKLDHFEDVVRFCSEREGYPATITSEEENAFLHEYLRGSGYDHVFVGCSDAEQDGVWKWSNGEPFVYEKWNEGEPNNDLGGEDNVAIYRILEAGGWNDLSYASPEKQLINASIKAISATSQLSNSEHSFSADAVVDGNTSTAWYEGATGLGAGESLEISFPFKYRVDGITVYIGDQESQEWFSRSSRPAVLRLEFDDDVCEEIRLDNIYGPQTIRFNETIVSEKVKVTIESVFAGSEAETTAISEILFQVENRPTGFICEWGTYNRG